MLRSNSSFLLDIFNHWHHLSHLIFHSFQCGFDIFLWGFHFSFENFLRGFDISFQFSFDISLLLDDIINFGNDRFVDEFLKGLNDSLPFTLLNLFLLPVNQNNLVYCFMFLSTGYLSFKLKEPISFIVELLHIDVLVNDAWVHHLLVNSRHKSNDKI